MSDDQDRFEMRVRDITLDDLLRIAYLTGKHPRISVNGGRYVRHLVQIDGHTYDLADEADRHSLLVMAK